MVIFRDEERLPYFKEQLHNLEEIQGCVEKIIELNTTKDPYGEKEDLLGEGLTVFRDQVKEALDAKILEIYYLEKEMERKHHDQLE